MLVLGLISTATQVYALNNGVGRTPAMGWNSWNKFDCNINEALIREHADAIVSSGLAELGYNHVNIDDCWQLSRDGDGFIQADPKAFPSGIRALSDYVHSKGLKFGLYSSAGTYTCQMRPGGLHFEKQDAQRYAEWQIDYFKYDNCHNEGMGDKGGTISRYGALRDAMNATGRPINYAICNWGEASIWEFGEPLGNSWRTTGDIRDSWESVQDLINRNWHLSKWSAPGTRWRSNMKKKKTLTISLSTGGFNDMDMLEVGNGQMTDIEYRTHFSVWAALKSPLLLGHDIRSMTPETFEIIGNTEIIAINQDALGKSAHVRAILDKIWVWVGELEGGDRVLLVMNAGETPVSLNIKFGVFAVTQEDVVASATYVVEARDLWLKQELGTFVGSMRLSAIPAHGSRVLRVCCFFFCFYGLTFDVA
ncbi:Melibiase family protein [Obelidium mucronatum]|nr:Melibiase family protein [Obelidium mucronatum]